METAVPLPAELLELLKQSLPCLRPPQRTRHAVDLFGLWSGLRTAVLLDSLILSEEEAERLGRGLSASSLPLFVIHEPATGQTLAVNSRLARQMKKEEAGCVEVGGEKPVLLDRLPPSSQAIFALIASHDPSSSPFLFLPRVERPYDLVGAVGRLLDYPIPYCFAQSEDGKNCLGGVELLVMEAFLVGSGGRQRIMSFSYPALLDDQLSNNPSQPGTVSSRLQYCLSRRLDQAMEAVPVLRKCKIEVEQHLAVLDQVAL
ncbi:hypothetical protein JCM8547_001250 [Rhodosporidiobolus lusitaniae]